MLPQLKFGIPSSPPYLFITSEGSLDGLSLPYFEAKAFNILRKFNITYINTSFQSDCDNSGFCTGQFGDLQSRLFDYGTTIPLNNLSRIPINLTITPTIEELRCFIVYKPKVNITLSNKSFFDSISNFDPIFSSTLLLFTLSLIIFLILTSDSKYQWNFIENLIKHNNIKQVINKLSGKIIYLTLIFTMLLIGCIFSASLQTGLLSTFDFIRFNSFEKIINHNYKIVILNYDYCKSEIEISKINSSNYLASKAIYHDINNSSPIEIYELTTAPFRLMIAEEVTIGIIKSLSCLLNHHERNIIYKSQKSMYDVIKVNLINKFLSQKVKSTIIQLYYSSFEMSVISNPKTYQLGSSTPLMNAKLSQICIDDKHDFQEEIIITSVTIEYLKLSFFILSTGHLIAIIIKSLEYFHDGN